LPIAVWLLHGQRHEHFASLFEKIDDNPPAADDRRNADNDEPAAYKYVATVTKPLLFKLAVRFTSS
jgi:hypothetical protein